MLRHSKKTRQSQSVSVQHLATQIGIDANETGGTGSHGMFGSLDRGGAELPPPFDFPIATLESQERNL